MARSVIALANPKILQWARESARMDRSMAAARVYEPEERIKAWETGELNITIAQLRKASTAYKRPLAIFFLSEIPSDFPPLHDYRKLPVEAQREFSSDLEFIVRRAREQQQWAREILEELGAEPISFIASASLEDDIVQLGQKIQELLSMQIGKRPVRTHANDTLRDWINACENLGLFVLQLGRRVDVAEMRGFSLLDSLAPFVVINRNDARAARVFTLLHEFAHLLIGADGISNENILYFDSRGEIGAREQRVEVFCNALAAEVLVPGEHLRRKVSRSDVLRDIDATIESLRKHYAVSREVIARRLVDTGFISRELYRKKRTQYIKEFEQRKAEEEQAKKPFRPAKPAAEVIRTNGRAFTRLILDAYGENILTASDVSSLLNTKLKNLASIEAEAFLGTPSRGVE